MWDHASVMASHPQDVVPCEWCRGSRVPEGSSVCTPTTASFLMLLALVGNEGWLCGAPTHTSNASGKSFCVCSYSLPKIVTQPGTVQQGDEGSKPNAVGRETIT